MKKCPNCNKIYGETDSYCLICNYPLKHIDESFISNDIKQLINRHEKAINNHAVININSNKIPKCVACGSINIHKISRGNKVGSAVVFGIFSVGHISKTFKCDNCGMKF